MSAGSLGCEHRLTDDDTLVDRITNRIWATANTVCAGGWRAYPWVVMSAAMSMFLATAFHPVDKYPAESGFIRWRGYPLYKVIYSVRNRALYSTSAGLTADSSSRRLADASTDSSPDMLSIDPILWTVVRSTCRPTIGWPWTDCRSTTVGRPSKNTRPVWYIVNTKI